MTDASKDPILRGIIERQKSTAALRGSVYADNAEGDKAAFVLPGGDKHHFVADPDGVNLNGANTAKLIYQARFSSEPTEANNSRVGWWASSVWDARASTPTDKQSRYSYYFTARGFGGDAGFSQAVCAVVTKVETPAGEEHAEAQALISIAAHERAPAVGDDAFAILTEEGEVLDTEAAESLHEESALGAYLPVNGKLVCHQNVLVFDGPGIDVDYDPETDEDGGAGAPDDNLEPATPRTIYPGYGTAWNNAGLTGGFAAAIVKARKPSDDPAVLGGVPWLHGYYVTKRGVSGYAFRYQKNFGVTAIGLGGRTMPYLGLGTDQPLSPVHVTGPLTLEQRFEYAATPHEPATEPYQLGGHSFYGPTSTGVATVKMAELRVEVTDPDHGSETAQLTLAARVDGRSKDRLHLGEGVWLHGAAGGDRGPGALNVSSLFVDGELELGEDPDETDAVTPIAVNPVRQNAKGMVVRSIAPTDRRFRGVQLYRNAVDDPATATPLDAYPGRPSKAGADRTIRIVDEETLTSGATYFYYQASLSKRGVESALRVRIGSAVYRGVQGADIEGGAVDFSTHVSGATKPANNATVGATAGTDLKDAAGAVLGNAEVVNSQATFAARKRWALKNSLQGWSVSNGTSALSPLYVTITGSNTNQLTLGHAVSYAGAETFKVRVRLRPKQTLVAGQWQGRCYWQTASHAADPSLYRKSLALPGNWAVNEWRVLEWDMSNPTVGGTDWMDNTITAIWVDFSQGAGLAFDVAWIAIGDDGVDPVELRSVADGATRNITYRLPAAPSGGAYTVGDHWIDTLSTPRVHYVWDGSAWEAVGRNTTTTLDLNDAKICARLDPSDLFDVVLINSSGGSYVSPITTLPVLTAGVDKPGLNVKNTGAADYNVTLAGGTIGDRLEISNHENSLGNVVVNNTFAGTNTLRPGQEGVFVYSSGGGGSFNLRLVRVLCDHTSNLIPPAMIPMGGAGKAQAWDADLDAVAALASPASLIAGAGQTGAANTWSGKQTMSAGVAVTGGMLNVGAASAVTIASDAIAVATSFVSVETQAGAGTDDLSTITGGTNGDLLIVKAATTGHSVVLKDGVGNLQLSGDCTLSTVQHRIVLMFQGSSWFELSRSFN